MKKKITILGSTGSIGTQTLDIVREYPELLEVGGLAAYSNIALLEKQAREFKPDTVYVGRGDKAAELRIKLADTGVKVISGKGGLCEIAALGEADTVVTAVVGIEGLLPTIAAIKAGKNIALANKETLVTGGHIVTALAKEKGVKLLPVDSEHSAIFQSLAASARPQKELKKILLTASGGPFFGKKKAELENVTPAQALKHPNWNMGAKVTIDSSTLVNKGLEVIEAKWLFGVSVDDIEVLVHRQSVVHSMVEFADNGIIAQLGAPDMRLPIQFALFYPYRLPMKGNALDFSKYPSLTFEKPDTDTFRALKLAYRAGREGGILPTAFNSADEAAVEAFMRGELSYTGITDAIEYTMDNTRNIQNPGTDDILLCDAFAREQVKKFIDSGVK